MKSRVIVACSIFFTVTACSPESSDNQAYPSDAPHFYVVGEDLARIRSDFNAMQDQVRLVFLIGPSCGICLRGMDDLNESIVQSIQNDPRAHTFAIHLPTLGADKKHVENSIPLLSGPRVTHYWNPGGTAGLAFQEMLDIPMYAWDLWFVYAPGARWQEGELPPRPDHWEHQLPSLPDELKFDAGRFAAEVETRLAALPPAAEGTKVAEFQLRAADIIPVAQPHAVMIAQNHGSRGGYHTLNRIQSIRYEGTTETAGTSYPLALRTERPHHYERRTGAGETRTSVAWDGEELTIEGKLPGLPKDFMNEMLASYDFDGWMTEWKDKGYRLRRLGMKKLDDRLPWILEVKLTNGRTWHVYVDSHSGDAFRHSLIEADGNESIRIEYSDFKEADGFRLPHQIQYFEDERLLATDRFSRIDVTMAAAGDTQIDHSGGDVR